MSVACPRCRHSIHADWDHCHECGLTVAQLERMVRVAGLATRDDPFSGAKTSHAPGGSPGYWAEPTYGQGPIARSLGWSPPAPGVSDLRRDDTVIDLNDGEAVVTVAGTGATAKLPQPPAAPRHHPTSNATTLHKVELGLTIFVAVVAIVLAILFVL